MPRATIPRRLGGSPSLSMVAALAALLLFLLVPGAAGAKPKPPAAGGSTDSPTGVVATVSTTHDGLGGALPDVLAQAGTTPITLTLTLTPAGATFNQDVVFDLGVSLAGGRTPAGTIDPGSVVLPRRQTTGAWTFTYSAVDNGVVVTAAPQKKIRGFTSTPAAPFQSLERLTLVDAGPGATTIGGDVCTVDSTDTSCATVYLPHGTASAKAALTVGACTADLQCPRGSQVVGFYADLGAGYTRTSPAQLTIRCDASRCGNGSINKYVVMMSFAPTGPLDLVSAPCAQSGVADDGQGHDYCTDYVATSRDSGDLLMKVLLLRDYRGVI